MARHRVIRQKTVDFMDGLLKLVTCFGKEVSVDVVRSSDLRCGLEAIKAFQMREELCGMTENSLSVSMLQPDVNTVNHRGDFVNGGLICQPDRAAAAAKALE